VPGEDLAWPVRLAVLLVASTTAGAATAAWGRSPPVQAPVAAVSPPPPAPIVSPWPSPPPPVTSVAAPAACPRIVIIFGNASAAPPEQADAPLNKLATWLVANSDATLVLDGHADSVGTDHGNLALSRSRAERVANVLVEHGVLRSRLTTRGFGAFNPVEGESDAAARNRRVVIHVRGGNGCPSANEEVIGL